MLDAAKRAEFDQAVAYFTEILPTLLANFRRGLEREGFTSESALQLTATLLSALVLKQTGG